METTSEQQEQELQDMAKLLGEMVGVPYYELGKLTGTQFRLSHSGLKEVMTLIVSLKDYWDLGKVSKGDSTPPYYVHPDSNAFISWD